MGVLLVAGSGVSFTWGESLGLQQALSCLKE